jgi:hypothetical protein
MATLSLVLACDSFLAQHLLVSVRVSVDATCLSCQVHKHLVESDCMMIKESVLSPFLLAFQESEAFCHVDMTHPPYLQRLLQFRVSRHI